MRQDEEADIKYRFGKAIRRRRRELDFSQEKLGELAGLHPTYISGIERGDRNPSLENIEKLAQALDLSLAELFTRYVAEAKGKP
ncbi:helix-turn-helix domain-containing protein [Egbenema bharatensis]|uniref:helix-turn-helix domain-containing protein n=1 Tax=Egbenema bharatensis TaxID=3463334 RepID=UPI000D04B590|nr:transcriptional regulator [filamentous cyanobacterium CCP2]PSB65869.1 transcriptional regulator [filamentous cyanobacterium CCP1]